MPYSSVSLGNTVLDVQYMLEEEWKGGREAGQERGWR